MGAPSHTQHPKAPPPPPQSSWGSPKCGKSTDRPFQSAGSWQLVTREGPLQEHCCIQSVFTCLAQGQQPPLHCLGTGATVGDCLHTSGAGPVALKSHCIEDLCQGWCQQGKFPGRRGNSLQDHGVESRTYLHRGHSFPGCQTLSALPQGCRGAPLSHSLG